MLQGRIDANPVGAPDSELLREILSIVFTDDEADIAIQMPFAFSSTGRLSRITGIPAPELEKRLEEMAEKGLLFDAERKGKWYWYLNPLVIGLFEFSMMRMRDDFDQPRLAAALHEYLLDDPDELMLLELAKGPTNLARTMVHEDQIDEGVVEVLDYERATHYVRSSDAWTVELCHCRHVAHHKGEPCDNPMELCMSFGQGAKFFARRGLGRAISMEEALDKLAQARELGLVQLGDNVKRNPLFICNCCSCCCGLLAGYRRLKENPIVHTSNFIAVVDAEKCTRCGKCVKACPVDIFTVEGKGKARRILMEEQYCMGCGVCATKCPEDAIRMVSRPHRVHTPESTLERVVRMAVERGKLQNLLFDDPGKVSHRVLRGMLKAVFGMPPARQLLAKEQLKSRFVGWFLRCAKYKPQPEV